MENARLPTRGPTNQIARPADRYGRTAKWLNGAGLLARTRPRPRLRALAFQVHLDTRGVTAARLAGDVEGVTLGATLAQSSDAERAAFSASTRARNSARAADEYASRSSGRTDSPRACRSAISAATRKLCSISASVHGSSQNLSSSGTASPALIEPSAE